MFTFVMIKPEHFELSDIILSELDKHGVRKRSSVVDCVPPHVIENHYSPHKGKPFYPSLIDSISYRQVSIAVYEGYDNQDDVVSRFMDITGRSSKPLECGTNTIRGKYSKDTMELANAENRPLQNVIHRSDCFDEARRETNSWLFFLISPEDFFSKIMESEVMPVISDVRFRLLDSVTSYFTDRKNYILESLGQGFSPDVCFQKKLRPSTMTFAEYNEKDPEGCFQKVTQIHEALKYFDLESKDSV